MKTNNSLVFIAVVFLVSTYPYAGFAQYESDSELPIEITADSMEWLNEKRIAVARGNADAVQGRYKLHAAILTAHMAEEPPTRSDTVSRIRKIEAEGNVVLTTPNETARGGEGTYDVENKIATLLGSVVLTQGDNVLHGQKLIMDLVTGRTRLEGSDTAISDDKRRVRAIFNPNDE